MKNKREFRRNYILAFLKEKRESHSLKKFKVDFFRKIESSVRFVFEIMLPGPRTNTKEQILLDMKRQPLSHSLISRRSDERQPPSSPSFYLSRRHRHATRPPQPKTTAINITQQHISLNNKFCSTAAPRKQIISSQHKQMDVSKTAAPTEAVSMDQVGENNNTMTIGENVVAAGESINDDVSLRAIITCLVYDVQRSILVG
jgi:hypothetical protein